MLMLSGCRLPANTSLAGELDDAVRRIPAPGGTMAVRFDDGGSWSGASGWSDVAASTKAAAHSRFKIWSISKTFTAALVLRLVDQGLVRLDDALTRWFPDFPLSDRITVRHLLSHTSGIPDYFTAPSVMAKWDEAWTPAQMLDVAAQSNRTFDPGKGWEYSNSNYVLLGRIVEMVAQSPLNQQIRAQLLERYGLADTFIRGAENIPGGYSPGYERDANGQWIDVTENIHPSVTWAVGQIVSSAEDLRTWCWQLFAGDVLTPSLREEAETPVLLDDGSKTGWGLGFAIVDTDYGQILGHGGGPLVGNSGSMEYLPSRKLIVTALANSSSDEAVHILGSAGWKTLLSTGRH
jgi:D-alanyl-D-alanine carboxypeptidase